MKIEVSNLPVRSLQGLLLLFLGKSDDFGNKNEQFYNSNIKKMLKTINDMPRQLTCSFFTGQIDFHQDKKKCFYTENSNMTWEEFLTKGMRSFTQAKRFSFCKKSSLKLFHLRMGVASSNSDSFTVML